MLSEQCRKDFRQIRREFSKHLNKICAHTLIAAIGAERPNRITMVGEG